MDNLERQIITFFDSKGQKSPQRFHAQLIAAIHDHELTNLVPLKNLNYNFICQGLSYDRPIILKISSCENEINREVNALQTFSNIAVKVIAFDKNLIIMEHVRPGITLKNKYSVDDLEATKVFCTILHKIIDYNKQITLHSEGMNKFTQVKKLLKILDDKLNIPPIILDKAKELRVTLGADQSTNILLHGDLHHENILLKENNEWIIIDPKGYFGDFAFDIAAFLFNPLPNLLDFVNPKQIVFDRVDFIAKEFNIDNQKILDWLYLRSVLSWAWCIKDNVSPAYPKQFIATIF